MGLPIVGVRAEVQNVSGYQSAIKTINNANDSAGQSVNHLSNIFDFAIGGVITNAIGGIVNIASQAAGAIVDFAGKSIDAAQKGQAVERQLDAVLKSTGGTTEAAITTQGHWATATALSSKEQAKLTKQIASATKTLDNQVERTNLMGKTTKSAAVSIQMSKEKLAGLNAELAKGTTVQQVWVNGQGQTNQVTHLTRKAYIDLATQMSNMTKFTKTDTLSAENLLLTFTKIGAKTFPTATKAVLDIATAMGEDTKSAAIQLGKALQNPLQGITALQRVGVVFSATQKQQIANFVRMGDIASAQKVILAELNTEFGGSAAAAATPWDILQNKIENFQETVGGALIPIFNGLAAAINPLIDKYMPQLVDLLSNQIGPAIVTATTVFGDFITNISDGLTPMDALNKALFESGVPADTVKSIDDFATGVSDTATSISDFITKAGGLPQILTDIGIGLAVLAALAVAPFIPMILLAVGIAAVVVAISDFNGKVVPLFASQGQFGAFGDSVRQAFQDAETPIVDTIVALSDFDGVLVPLFAHGGKFGSFGDQFRQAFQDALTPIVKATMAIDDFIKKLAILTGNATGNKPAVPGETIGVQPNGTTNSGGIYDMLHGNTGKVQGPAPAQPEVKPTVTTPDAAQVTTAMAPLTEILQKATPPVDLTTPVKAGADASHTYIIGGWAPGFKTDIKTTIDGGKAAASEGAPAVGKGIVDGIVSGIVANGTGIGDALVKQAQNAIQRTRESLDIHSPSKVFAMIGMNMMQGWQQGISNNAALLTSAVQSASASSIMSAINPSPLALPSNTTNNSMVNNNSNSNTTVFNLGVQPYQPQNNASGSALALLR